MQPADHVKTNHPTESPHARESGKPELSRRHFLASLAGKGAATSLLVSSGMLAGAELGRAQSGGEDLLIIERSGSFFAGGTTVTAPGVFDPTKNLFSSPGDTYSIDHLYVQFQIPPAARTLPLVMVHGAGQTGKTWESTPDGREGFQTLFVKRGFGVYVVDFPRRGRAGFPSFTGPLGALSGTQIIPDETLRYGHAAAFLAFRLGLTPFNFFANSQFPQAGLDQYFKQSVPDVIDDPDVASSAIAALFDQIGPGILVTHSQSGSFGWLAATKTTNIKAIIAFEPISFYFPEGMVPTPPPLFDGSIYPAALPVAPADFQKLSKIPIQIVYGDNIPVNPVPIYGQDLWRVITAVAPQFVSAINAQGGNASLLSLPEAGLSGNTHFAFADLNNIAVANLLSDYLSRQGLDGRV